VERPIAAAAAFQAGGLVRSTIDTDGRLEGCCGHDCPPHNEAES